MEIIMFADGDDEDDIQFWCTPEVVFVRSRTSKLMEAA